MVEFHVYGKLRRYTNNSRQDRRSVIMLEPSVDETIASLLAQVEIPAAEINHIFVNAELLASRTSMAPYLGYVQSRANLFDWDLSVPVNDGDRIGLFGKDMAMLGM
jgi:hypothetical protein